MRRTVDKGRQFVGDFNRAVDSHVQTVHRGVKSVHRTVTDHIEQAKSLKAERLSLREFLARIWDILRQDRSPHSLALGFALGLAIGILPITIVGLVIGLILTFWLRANKLMFLLGFIMDNPLIMVFLYPLSFEIGNQFFHTSQAFEWGSVRSWLGIWKPLLIGNLILAVGMGVAGYILVYVVARVVGHYHRQKGGGPTGPLPRR